MTAKERELLKAPVLEVLPFVPGEVATHLLNFCTQVDVVHDAELDLERATLRRLVALFPRCELMARENLALFVSHVCDEIVALRVALRMEV